MSNEMEKRVQLVREMVDVQGQNGNWDFDPYMQGLYNGLEFALSLLEQREPEFKSAPKAWLADLPKPRIFDQTEESHEVPTLPSPN